MTPNDDLTFADLCEYIGASPVTVKRRLADLGISPSRTIGTAKLFTRRQADRVKAYHAKHGGRWPQQSIR